MTEDTMWEGLQATQITRDMAAHRHPVRCEERQVAKQHMLLLYFYLSKLSPPSLPTAEAGKGPLQRWDKTSNQGPRRPKQV